ncbi:hypothetical protein MED297_17148 [Reinekea sp. MED297]|uniref:Uncharacterized protein n=2 Tax=Reinekea TaxID=230494 RepID=A4BFJ5_9GAMM|nr:hypothetical protein MED297_17148 [Reinekea sp. MED297] [Reinekea blandensis MED297]
MNPLAVVSSNNSLIVKYSKVKGERYVGITDALADGFFDEAQCQAVQLLEQAFNDIDEGCADDWVHALTFFYVKDVPHGTKQIDGSRFYYAESDGKTFVFVSVEGRVFFLDSDFLDPQSLINTVVQPEL